MMALGWSAPSQVCTALALALGLAAAWRWLRARRSPELRLKRVGTVSGLFLYPLKSCRGLSVDKAEVTELGLRSGVLSDRCWTVMKEDGEMLSAKEEPRLVLISVTHEDGYITLNAPEMKALKIPLQLPRTNSIRNCRRLGAEGEGRDCGEEAAQWITTFLNTKPYRLAHYEPNMMTRKSRDVLPEFEITDEVAYAEGSPILLISEASLDDLNSRLEEKVSITNFRPNIFVTGCAPFEEDSWSQILIGNVQMKGILPCPRCIFTTIDPNTGIMHKKEPLKTLKRYRKYASTEQHSYKSFPPFGCLYGIEKTGMLAVGDPVYEII
ncbi:mitochondrial amidoxime reducing component 2 [Anolis carolinensis]|uniref:MOSC domain-containing protein n=1 Tax=Anolis carolinensis TaxID=28377 RepID=R4G964_ANOCA|nr:PREDICTED: mitochondrial amidoxime reducing component 2 [Anolis carolinensis]|eukprot:XP_003216077.2 PREDICTED: mitochondrial amidoxime reducing component 2 [Anolis carolinensis]